tara:strand:- start:3800 stop:4423 length:624 start_codon:yes stop_codon:yes gene_type:complete
MKNTIHIIDLGINNVSSVCKAIEYVGFDYKIINSRSDISNAGKIILPGVGSFDQGMSRLAELELVDAIRSKAITEKVPILGICLGFQMMTRSSEEGELDGLALFDCHTQKIRPSQNENIKVPHMGWNEVNWKKDSKLTENINVPSRFYFVHSYVPISEKRDEVLATTYYGCELTIAFERENIIGVQFHPEKSHIFGLKIIENFCKNY